jgi:hypothetical protein
MTVVAAERARDGLAPSAVGAQIAMALGDRIGRVIGSGGFEVLLRRSLVLARRNHPILVEVSVSPGGQLAFSDDTSSDPSAMWSAITDLLGTFVDLLAELVGEELAFRLVQGA